MVQDTREPSPNADVADTINGLLGVYWGAYAQHQMHVALLDAWGIKGLASDMGARIVDEPVTIRALSDRLLDIDGEPAFTIVAPKIGKTLREVLANDLELQAGTRPALNAAAEVASAAHDATSRIMLEGILADEEEHLSWLQTELSLLDRLGEALYISNRLNPSPTSAA